MSTPEAPLSHRDTAPADDPELLARFARFVEEHPAAADALPGIPKDALEPSDLVLAYNAQEQALLKFLPAFTRDVDEAVAVAMRLRSLYARVQDEAFQRFARARDESAARAAESVAQEFQALNEELQSQQVELQALYEQQRKQIGHLQQADRYKDEFLSVISHELRTPLNFIMGFSSVLGDGVAGALNDEQLACVEKILGGADRMLTLVDDLLDVAKIQSGKLELNPAPVRFESLVQRVAAELAPLAGKKRVALHVEPAPDVHPWVDAGRITQVLTNLLSNAIKFTEPEGAITVRVRREGDALRTEVADTGPGIPSEDQARIFERFRQLDMGQTRKVGGTGLGLAIAKALVEAHGGAIGVQSVPREGSTFYFTLPLGAPASSRPG